MANEWQVKMDGKVLGPFSDSQLRQLLDSGRIRADAPVRRGENSVWTTAEKAIAKLPSSSRDASPATAPASKDSRSSSESELSQPPASRQDGQPVPAARSPKANRSPSEDAMSQASANGNQSYAVASSSPQPNRPLPNPPFVTYSPPPQQTRKCPYCLETILVGAVKCKHCGEFLDGRPAVPLAVQQPTWSPGTAAVLSFLIPGLGQIYKGRIGLGLLVMVLAAAGYAFFVIPGVIVHMLAVSDAYWAKEVFSWRRFLGIVAWLILVAVFVVVLAYLNRPN